MTMEESLRKLVSNYINRKDWAKLDALYQWATNQTSGTAVNKGQHPNHHPLKSNLKLRYELTGEQAEEVYANFKADIESAGFEFNTGYFEAREGIEEYFAQDPVLKDAVLLRLKTAPQNVQYIAWLFSKTEGYFGILRGKEDLGNFAALLGAAFNIQITNSEQQVIEPLIKLGFLNETCWTSVRGNNHRDVTCPEYLEPLVADIYRHVSLPDLPNFREYIDAVFARRRVTVLVGLEELFKGYKPGRGREGITSASDIIGEIIPQPYLIGKCGSVLAINPRIYTEMKNYFFEKKHAILRSQGSIQHVLGKLHEKYYPDISFNAIDLFPSTFSWEMHTSDKTLSEKDILIILAPWLTKDQIEGLRKEASSKFLAIVSTVMGIPELNDAFRKVYGTDIQGVDWVVIDTTRTPFVERAAAVKPQLLSELLNMLGLQQDGANEPAKALQKETKGKVADEEDQQKGHLGNSPPLAQLELGHRASLDELRSLMEQSGLAESERREKLTSQGVFYYPLSIATTHTAIFGTNNSGKSTTTKRLVSELVRNNVPVLVLDWHDEYHALIKGLGGIVCVPPTATTKPAPGEMPFTWNILDPHFYAAEVTPAVIEDYIGVVVDILAPKGLMGLTDPMKGGLVEALKLAYTSSTTPTFASILDVIEHVSIPPTTADALRRRVRTFSTGSLGSIFGNSTTFNPQEVFNKPVCVRVKHLTVDHESAVGLLMFFALRQVESHFKRMEKGKEAGQARVRHVCVIDEAPMAMGSNPRVKKEVVRMLQELRGFGVGLVLVCRNTRIGDDILGETNQKIAHRLDVPSDVNKVAAMLELKEKDLLHRLPPGVAFARVAGNPTALVRITPT